MRHYALSNPLNTLEILVIQKKYRKIKVPKVQENSAEKSKCIKRENTLDEYEEENKE